MISVVIVDDHEVVRQGLRAMLESQEEITIVGEGSDGEHAITTATELLPDVMLLDLLMPRMDGITAIREIKRLIPTTQIIVLTSYYEDDYIFRAIKAGALSYLLKDCSPQELIIAIHAAARGESRLHPMIAMRILQGLHQQEQSRLVDLTTREREVLTLLARGRSNAEIAAELVISEGTVKKYVSNILSKLHLADRTQAAIYALQQRLVPLKDALDKEEFSPFRRDH